MQKLVYGILAAILVIAATANAQTAATNPPASYVVQPGDTGWELAKSYYDDATMWRLIVELNPVLKEPGRVFERDGKIILRLKPGEELFGFNRLKERFDVAPPTAVPIEKLAAVAPVPAPVVKAEGINWWKWALLGLFALVPLIALVDYIKREREKSRDPVTSGPPFVAGGVRPTDTARLEQALRTAAVSEYVRLNPGVERHTVRVERIGRVESGLISGEGMVGYADRARARRINPPQQGYRARFRFPDGREDFLMSLQGCMNPCYYGEGMTGFRFEPQQEVMPTPEPERPGPTALPHPAIALRAAQTAAQARGNNLITIGGETMEFPQGYHLDVNRETGVVTLEATAFKMVVERKKPARERATTTRSTPVAATGTGDAS